MNASDTRPLLLLVGAGSRLYREYLLRSIAECYRVHLVSPATPAWESEYLDGWTEVATPTDVDQLLAAADRVSTSAPIGGVLTWDEATVLPVSTLAARLGLPGAGAAAAERCRDKHLGRAALAAAGVPQPASTLVATLPEALTAAERIGYPVVLKPRALAASLGVVRVDDPDQFRAHFAFARDTTVPGAPSFREAVLVEAYADGPEISIDSAVHGGRVMPMYLARKELGYPPYFEETGHSVAADDPLLGDAELLAVLRDAHAALGFTDGMTHAELRLTPAGPVVIEINGRLGGGLIPYLGLRATGIDPGLAAAAVASGRAPDLRADRALVGAIRFFYAAAADTVLGPVAFDVARVPAAIDLLVPLLPPGTVVSPPPKGTTFGRVAYATAVAETVDECRAALDAAGAVLTMTADAPDGAVPARAAGGPR